MKIEFKKTNHYDIDTIFRYVFIAVVAIVFWKVTSGVGSLLVSLFIINSIVRHKIIDMFFGLLFITFALVGNAWILSKTTMSMNVIRVTLLLLPILLMSEFSTIGRDSRLITPFLGIIFYLIWETFVSLQGFNPIISYFKLLFFFLVFIAMFSAANTVNHSQEINAQMLRSAILAIISLVIIGSFIMIPFPALRYSTGEMTVNASRRGEWVSLFHGLTATSQVFGTVGAMMATFLFVDLTFFIKKYDKFYILLLLLCLFLVYKSSSRTGMGALVSGIGLTLFLFIQNRETKSKWKRKFIKLIDVIIIIGAILLCVKESFRENTIKFTLKTANKNAETDFTIAYMVSSRQPLIDESLRNFKNKPLVGNGFQVSSDMLNMKPNGILGYFNAPIEKGVWIYAILEEGGIIGMILFCIWLLLLFCLLLVRHAYIGATVFFVFLIANLGEFMIFSMSYSGGFCWFFTFASLCLDLQQLKAFKISNLHVPNVTNGPMGN